MQYDLKYYRQFKVNMNMKNSYKIFVNGKTERQFRKKIEILKKIQLKFPNK